MPRKTTMQAIGLATLIGTVLVGPLHSEAAGRQVSSLFKPPMPCAAVRARISRLHLTGWCSSTRGPGEVRKLLIEPAGGLDPVLVTFRR
jgi:hypothetical protein